MGGGAFSTSRFAGVSGGAIVDWARSRARRSWVTVGLGAGLAGRAAAGSVALRTSSGGRSPRAVRGRSSCSAAGVRLRRGAGCAGVGSTRVRAEGVVRGSGRPEADVRPATGSGCRRCGCGVVEGVGKLPALGSRWGAGTRSCPGPVGSAFRCSHASASLRTAAMSMFRPFMSR
jgi:hypothetical protein